MHRIRALSLLCLTTLLVAGTAAAQTNQDDPRHSSHSNPAPPPTNEDPWQVWLKGQGHYYENFFQAPDNQPKDNVSAILAEIGASYRLSRTTPLRVYGNADYLRYDDNRLDASPGARIGLRLDGRPHYFDVYAEQLWNRPTFDVGEEFDTADIRNLAADYAFRFTRDWQVSVNGALQKQNYDITTSRDNNFKSLGGAVRWRPSRYFSPEVGYNKGNRDVDDPTFSYDENEWYVQVRSAPVSSLYLSLRYRDRTRDYTTDLVTNSNFGREDKRHQIAFTGSWSFTKSLSLDAYITREHADINRANRDFDTSLYLAGLTWKF